MVDVAQVKLFGRTVGAVSLSPHQNAEDYAVNKESTL